MINPSYGVPQIGLKIYTRCIACRIDEKGDLQSFQKGDVEKFIDYFPLK